MKPKSRPMSKVRIRSQVSVLETKDGVSYMLTNVPSLPNQYLLLRALMVDMNMSSPTASLPISPKEARSLPLLIMLRRFSK